MRPGGTDGSRGAQVGYELDEAAAEAVRRRLRLRDAPLPVPAQLVRPADSAAIILAAVGPPEPCFTVQRARWGFVPDFHHGPVAAWRAHTACAPVETLTTREAFRRAAVKRRALVACSSLYLASDESRSEGLQVSWPAQGGRDPFRFLPAIWEESAPSDVPEGLTSFAIVVQRVPRALLRSCGQAIRGWRGALPPFLTLGQALAWVDVDSPPQMTAHIALNDLCITRHEKA